MMNPALNPAAMTRIMIPITVKERELLKQSAKMDLREPREHARYLLRVALGLVNIPTATETKNEAVTR
jgi:hypothetical protein